MMRRELRWIASGGMTVLALAAVMACKKVLGLGDPEPYGAEPGRVDGATGDADTVSEGGAPAPSCAANLVTDPKHCGRCDHDCRGSACQGGHCVPVLVGNVKGGTGIFVVDAGNVYAADNDEIVKFDPAGKRTKIVTPIGATPIAMFVDQNYVLWSSWGEGVLACPLVGCSGPPLRVSSSTRTGAVTALPGLASPWQYVWVDLQTSSIAKAGPDGGTSLVPVPGVDETRCANFATAGSTAYFADSPRNRILSLRSDGTSKAAAGAQAPCAIATHGNQLYFTDEFNVWRAGIKADGSLENPIAIANGQAAPRTIIADEDYVYWAPSTQSDTPILRCQKMGCDLKPETIVSGLPRTVAIDVDETWIYFAVAGSYTVGAEIWKVAK
jgi:hypothetical protein